MPATRVLLSMQNPTLALVLAPWRVGRMLATLRWETVCLGKWQPLVTELNLVPGTLAWVIKRCTATTTAMKTLHWVTKACTAIPPGTTTLPRVPGLCTQTPLEVTTPPTDTTACRPTPQAMTTWRWVPMHLWPIQPAVATCRLGSLAWAAIPRVTTTRQWVMQP